MFLGLLGVGERVQSASVGYCVRRCQRVCPAHTCSPESVSESLRMEHSRLGERVGIKVSDKTLETGESWENRDLGWSPKESFMESSQGHSSRWAQMMGF